MPYKFNPFLKRLQYYEPSGSSPDAGPENFFYELIEEGDQVEIPQNQVMFTEHDLIVDGDLVISGNLKRLPGRYDAPAGFAEIESGETLLVTAQRQFLYFSDLIINGDLFLIGEMKGV